MVVPIYTDEPVADPAGSSSVSTSASTRAPSSAPDRTDPAQSQSKWSSGYGDFIVKNASAVTQIETALRSLMYLVPGRFNTEESQVATESIHAGVQLLSMYHDGLLARAVDNLPAGQRPHGSTHNRYTAFWCQKSATYRRLARLVRIVQYTELLWEMLARRRGERTRWRVVVFLESIKALCRLFLLKITRGRMLLSPAVPEREVDPAQLEQSARRQMERQRNGSTRNSSSSSSTTATEEDDDERAEKWLDPFAEPEETEWQMPRTGLNAPATLPETTDVTGYLLGKVLSADDIRPAPTLLRRLSFKGEIAEVLFIIRPVLYALAMQKWFFSAARTGRAGSAAGSAPPPSVLSALASGSPAKFFSAAAASGWAPWLLGAAVELGARELARQAQSEDGSSGAAATALERDELKRRGWPSLGWWALRGPAYDSFARPWIRSAAERVKRVPLLGMVAGVVEESQFLWDEYYFPTATM